MPSEVVASRLVMMFPGFEPMPPAAHLKRFFREAERSGETWGVEFEGQEEARLSVEESAADPVFSFKVVARGTDWRTETEVVFFAWADLIEAYRSRSSGRRMGGGLAALAAFCFSGTLWRYCAVSWRYCLFFLYPLAITLGIGLLGVLIGLLPLLLHFSPGHFVWSLPAAALAALWLTRRADRRLHLLTLMDDWVFALDLVHGRNSAAQSRIEAFAGVIARRVAEAEVDEIVVTAHSLGAVFAVESLALALDEAPPARPLSLMTLGSSLLKIGLHPKAAALRRSVEALVVRHRLAWLDVQSLTDPINFYKSNPATSLGIRRGRTPDVMRIRFRSLLSWPTYRRVRTDLFRIHRQFVLGVERRGVFAFHLVVTGPQPFNEFAATRRLSLQPRSRATANLPAD